jgi:hypothetical protein
MRDPPRPRGGAVARGDEGGIISGEWRDQMIGIPELAAQLNTEDLEQARRMTGSQKLRAGGDLFDEACRWTLAGIRADRPGISEEEALNELRRRVEEGEKAVLPAW